VFADCCESPPLQMPAGAEQLTGTTDLIGYNRYFGWYYGKPAGLGAALDTLHKRHPALPISVSEYGAGGALTQHTDNPLGGPVHVFGRPHPEQFQSWYHEQSWPEIQSRPFVWGSWIWNMFDFVSDLREEGDAVDINDKGLVTFDRKVKKDAFFYYKAQWSSDPVVHINSARYTERAYPVTDVRVYSNAPSVRLRLNDADLGQAICEARVCVWREVKLRAGANTLTASADFSGNVVADSGQWNAPDAARGLRIDAGDVVGHRGPDGQQVGSDNFFNGGESRLLNGYGLGSFGAHGPPAPARKTVVGAADSTLHDGYRIGTFSYDIPLPDGEWLVTLHAFEPNERLAESRTFNVIANDFVQVEEWSPGQAAGGALKATQISFKARVRDGRLRLRFEPVGGPALISAIVVEP
jgi:beta-galactosidase